MDIRPIDDNTWRFTEDGVSFYLLRGSERALFIDGGKGGADLHARAAHLTDFNLSLINTSCISCCLGANDEFSRFYMSPSDSFIYYNRLGRVGIIKPVFDGDVIDLGERKVEIISFPGITPGSVVVLDYLSGAVFGGCSITDATVDLAERYSDIHAYLMSAKRFASYREKYDVIYPSVGSAQVGPAVLEHLENTARDIIRKNIIGEVKDDRVVYSDGFVSFALRREDDDKR